LQMPPLHFLKFGYACMLLVVGIKSNQLSTDRLLGREVFTG
jgi:hypothetical protein